MCEDLWTTVKKTPLEFEIPGHPPSVNRIWRKSGHRIFKIKEATDWDRMAGCFVAKAAIKAYRARDLTEVSGRPVKLELSFLRPTWRGRTKAKKVLYVRPDLSNFIKVAEDAVLDALGVDDCSVVELMARKVEDPGPERTRVRVTWLMT